MKVGFIVWMRIGLIIGINVGIFVGLVVKFHCKHVHELICAYWMQSHW